MRHRPRNHGKGVRIKHAYAHAAVGMAIIRQTLDYWDLLDLTFYMEDDEEPVTLRTVIEVVLRECREINGAPRSLSDEVS